MIEKIYIPTLHRVDNQITYDHLPDSLRGRVVFVVQEWERDQYAHDVEYLVLPPEINKEDRYCLAKTRQYIYQTAGKKKYVVIDDDVKFARRNRKYFGEPSNDIETKRFCRPDEVEEMFTKFDTYLDEFPVCGCYPRDLPPSSTEVSLNRPVYTTMFLNGEFFHEDLKTWDLTTCRTGEDVNFFLHLLTNGHQIRRDNEFLVSNNSMKKVDSFIWDTQTAEDSLKDVQTLCEMFPHLVSYVDDGKGYKGQPRMKVKWKDAYNNSEVLPI